MNPAPVLELSMEISSTTFPLSKNVIITSARSEAAVVYTRYLYVWDCAGRAGDDLEPGLEGKFF